MLPLTLLGIAFFLSGLALSSRGAHDGTDKNEREGSSAL
jgi:hypothetical protein